MSPVANISSTRSRTADAIELDGRAYPVAEVVKIETNRTFPEAVVVVAKCPICPRRHEHGAPRSELDRPHLGHRVAHCAASRYPSRGYVLGPVGAVEIPEHPSRRHLRSVGGGQRGR